MAVQSDTSSISYTGNNSTVTTYAVPFYFLENSHLSAIAKVTSTGVESAVTLTNHTGAGDPNGGTVRTAVAVPATSTLTIFRTVPATQTTTYQEGGDFPAASHERALDKLTFIAQQNERLAERSIRVTEADGARNEFVAAANTVIGLDANKQPKTMTVSDLKTYLALTGVTLDVNAGMKTFADAGERALAVPDFTGQLGTQRDTADIYISTGTAAGNWSLFDVYDPLVVDANVSASAAIAGTKIAPNFGSQNVVTTGTATAASLTPTGTSVPTNGLYSPSANNVALATNGVARMRIASTGLVKIGVDVTDNAVAPLDVKTDLANRVARFAKGSAYCDITVDQDATANRTQLLTSHDFAIRTNAASTAQTPVWCRGANVNIQSKLGVNLTGSPVSEPDVELHVSGTIRYVNRPAAGTITAIGFDTNGDLKASSSSLRYKHNVEPYAKGLAEVAQLEPVTFNYNGEELVNAGLIVEDLDAKGFEEFVLRDSEGTADAIPYGNMVALLINAIKELKTRVEELEAAQ